MSNPCKCGKPNTLACQSSRPFVMCERCMFDHIIELKKQLFDADIQKVKHSAGIRQNERERVLAAVKEIMPEYYEILKIYLKGRPIKDGEW